MALPPIIADWVGRCEAIESTAHELLAIAVELHKHALAAEAAGKATQTDAARQAYAGMVKAQADLADCADTIEGSLQVLEGILNPSKEPHGGR